MKRSLLVLLHSLLCFSVYGQITLLDTDYPSSMLGLDSLKKTTYSSSFPVMSTLLGGAVDFTSLADSPLVFYNYRVPVISFQYCDSSVDNIGSFNFSSNVVANIMSNGLYEYATDIKDTRYSLLPVTAVPTDSIIILPQTSAYTEPRCSLYLPLTLADNWINSYHYDIDFFLSLSLASLDHAPAIRRRYIDEYNEVIGWGSARVTDLAGSSGSPYFNVLQVKARIIITDSFFIDGLPAAPISLTALSLTQGSKDTTYEYNYYRKGEVTPLVKIEFKDAGYTQPFRGTTHVQRIFTNNVANNERLPLTIYPNPTDNGILHVQLPSVETDCSYQLTGVDGILVASGTMTVTSSCATIHLPKTTQGVYLLKIKDGESAFSTCVQVN